MAVGRIVIDGLVCADPAVMAWADGERELWWSRAAALDHGLERDDWPTAVAGADKLSDLTPEQVPWLIAKGPDAPARALLGTAKFLRHSQRGDMGRVAVARFELDALGYALAEAGESADRLGLLLLPFRGPEPAALVSGWLRQPGSARLWARLWLERHPEAAARALIPAAAGRPGRARQNAEVALRFLSASGHGPVVRETAGGYGVAALALIEALLATEPAITGRSGKVPGWLRPEALPEVGSNDGTKLPEDRVVALIDALSRSGLDEAPEPPPGDPAPGGSGLPLVVEAPAAAQPMIRPADPETAALIAGLDRPGLAAFGRALLAGWVEAGMPPAESWVVLAQAHIGDDETVEALAPLVRSWPATGRHQRAVDGYAVLATMGTDAALRHFLAIETNMVGGPTNERALYYLGRGAAARGLSVTRLADRMTITHGLDAGVAVDYGTRSFPVHADELLVAHVRTPDGRVLARPPKPGVRDTRPEGYQWFLQFKKDLRATATAQTARLEQDMLARRLRPAGDFPGVLLRHPVLGPLVRRLLWGEYDGRRLVRALRIAEDGSFADRHDNTADVPGDTPLAIVHPADLGPDLAAWSQIFADYEILQPFPQVNRPLVALTEEQRAATSLAGFGPVTADQLLLLMRQRWHGNGYHVASRTHTRIEHALPDGLTLLAELSPGMPTSSYAANSEHRITEFWLDDDWSDHWRPAHRIPMGAADPAALSEALVGLSGARG